MKATLALVWLFVLGGTTSSLFFACTDKAPTVMTVCPDAGDGGDAGCYTVPVTVAAGGGGGGW